eukprot:327303-Pleurochrysis_carterae.AAC.3
MLYIIHGQPAACRCAVGPVLALHAARESCGLNAQTARLPSESTAQIRVAIGSCARQHGNQSASSALNYEASQQSLGAWALENNTAETKAGRSDAVH